MGIFGAIDDAMSRHKASAEARKFAKDVVLGKPYYCIETHMMPWGGKQDLVHEWIFTRRDKLFNLPMCDHISAVDAWNRHGPFFEYEVPGVQTLADYLGSEYTTNKALAKAVAGEHAKDIAENAEAVRLIEEAVAKVANRR